MGFADSPEHAAFRSEFRHWLEANLPAEIKVDAAADQRVAPDREILEQRVAWQKAMHAAGWAGISWPTEYMAAGRRCHGLWRGRPWRSAPKCAGRHGRSWT